MIMAFLGVFGEVPDARGAVSPYELVEAACAGAFRLKSAL
jgi:hypothetical protein